MKNQALKNKKCRPCEGGVSPLHRKEAAVLLNRLPPEWTFSGGGKAIRAEYRMKNFIAAVDFINRIAAIAESEDHHPDLHLTGYRRLVIELSTHAIKGLSENDFILAAKIAALPKRLKKEKP